MNEVSLLIKGGTLVDSVGLRRGDIAISTQGLVSQCENNIEIASNQRVIDASGLYVSPGFIDLHTHLREPGNNEAETILSGTRKAALGGFTSVVAMPNTNPSVDCTSMVHEIKALAKSAVINVEIASAITADRKGGSLVNMKAMADLGVVMFTDDGSGVQDSSLMDKALSYAGELGVVIAQHLETNSISKNGLANLGPISQRLGIPGIAAASEEIMLARDLILLKNKSAKYHAQHISTSGSLEIVEIAKQRGLNFTCEVTPHHLFLDDALVEQFNPIYKVNPPLRGLSDIKDMRRGVLESTIDAIATDHAPHTLDAKERSFSEAPCGIESLDIALGIILKAFGLDNKDEFDADKLIKVIDALTIKPRNIISKRPKTSLLDIGASGDLAIFSLEEKKEVPKVALSPYRGMDFMGKVIYTICGGKVVVENGVGNW
ncbi:MAG: dihydroorotase [Acidimicrobiales bacterium]|nr:dihydroorotase [Acidimicrobiales bacterium]